MLVFILLVNIQYVGSRVFLYEYLGIARYIRGRSQPIYWCLSQPYNTALLLESKLNCLSSLWRRTNEFFHQRRYTTYTYATRNTYVNTCNTICMVYVLRLPYGKQNLLMINVGTSMHSIQGTHFMRNFSDQEHLKYIQLGFFSPFTIKTSQCVNGYPSLFFFRCHPALKIPHVDGICINSYLIKC